MDSSNVDESNENYAPQNSSFSTNNPGPAKKRKISMAGTSSLIEVQLKVLQFENTTLKKVVEDLENKLQNQNRNNEYEKEIAKLHDSMKILESKNATLQSTIEKEKQQHKIEVDLLHSTCDEYLSKNKVLEEKNQKLEESDKKLKDEILSMKTIKAEIKDSVEEENEKVQTKIEELNAEITDLKNKNIELVNDKQMLKESFDEYKKTNEDLKMKGSETHYYSLSQVAGNKFKVNLSLMSCKQKKLLVEKIVNTYIGMEFYSTINSKTPYFMGYQAFLKNICVEIVTLKNLKFQCHNGHLNDIIPRINVDFIQELNLRHQNITLENFCKLISYRNIEECTLEDVNITETEGSPYPLYKILEELPKIKRFHYSPPHLNHLPNETAQQLAEKLETFPELRQFTLSKIPYDFDLEIFSGFVKKNPNAYYFFNFSNVTEEYMKTTVITNRKKLMDSVLPLICRNMVGL